MTDCYVTILCDSTDLRGEVTYNIFKAMLDTSTLVLSIYTNVNGHQEMVAVAIVVPGLGCGATILAQQKFVFIGLQSLVNRLW